MDSVLHVAGSIPLLVGALLVTAALGRYLVDSAADGRSSHDVDPREAIDRDAKTVTCPECGSENELGYVYCGTCVAELPGVVRRTPRRNEPSRRDIF